MAKPRKVLVKYNKDEGNVLLKEELLKQIKDLFPEHPIFITYNECSVSAKEAASVLIKSLRGK